MEVGGPNFLEEQVENRTKTRKMLQILGYLGAIVSVSPPPPPSRISEPVLLHISGI